MYFCANNPTIVTNDFFKRLKSSDDETLFSLFNLTKCYETTDSDFPSFICCFEIEGTVHRFQYLDNDTHFNVFQKGEDSFTSCDLLTFLFNNLPLKKREKFIFEHFDEDQANNSIGFRFIRFLKNKASDTMFLLCEKNIHLEEVSPLPHKKKNTSFTFKIKGESKKYSFFFAEMLNLRIFSEIPDDFTSDATVKIDLHSTFLTEIEANLQIEFPGISFASFCTHSTSSKSRISLFLHSLLEKSDANKLFSLFNTQR